MAPPVFPRAGPLTPEEVPMRYPMLIVSLLVIAVSASANPPDHKADAPAAKTSTTTVTKVQSTTAPLNNVVRTAADGTRTALCCCGHEFTVTAKSPTYEHGGTTFYMCGDACKASAMAASPADAAKSLAEWRTKFDAEMLATNAKTADGKTTAVCGCGKSFTVTDSSPVVTENGVRMYCCSPACHDHFMKMSADQRLAEETKIAKANQPAKAKM
jgi:hypothetical protein